MGKDGREKQSSVSFYLENFLSIITDKIWFYEKSTAMIQGTHPSQPILSFLTNQPRAPWWERVTGVMIVRLGKRGNVRTPMMGGTGSLFGSQRVKEHQSSIQLVSLISPLLSVVFIFLRSPSVSISPLISVIIPLFSYQSTIMSSTCNNCFTASQQCNKAKEELKCSRNEVKRTERNLLEKEKEIVLSRAKIEELKAQRQARLALKEQMAEMQRELTQLMAENEELTAQQKKIRASKPMSREERREMIFWLKDEIFNMSSSRFMDKAIRLSMSEDWRVKKLAQYEAAVFREQRKAYQAALEANLATIQGNPNISRSEVPPLPKCPAFSEKFEEEFQKAEEARNRVLEEECVICTEIIDKKWQEDLFTCPVCQKSIHVECIEMWFKLKQSCPWCRAEWN